MISKFGNTALSRPIGKSVIALAIRTPQIQPRTEETAMRPIVICVLLFAAGTTADDPVLQRADRSYAIAVKKATENAEGIRRDAGKKRLKVYEAQLRKATRAGDFKLAQELNRRIHELKREALLLPRPKNAVRFGGHTYALFDEKVTWHVAKRRCEEMGGYLVCVETGPERAFATKLAGTTAVWWGGTDEEKEGTWLWVTGKPVPYSGWADNRGGVEHHLMSHGDSLNDVVAGMRLAYICEWE